MYGGITSKNEANWNNISVKIIIYGHYNIRIIIGAQIGVTEN